MKVDMSSKAVTVRLKRVSQLRRLCLALGKATPVRLEVSATHEGLTESSTPEIAVDASPIEGRSKQ